MARSPEEELERKKKIKLELDELREKLEKVEWKEDAEKKGFYTAILKKAPFKGWKMGIYPSQDKWEMGALEYSVVPCLGPNENIRLGGPGFWSHNEAEIDMLKRLIKLKGKIQNEDKS